MQTVISRLTLADQVYQQVTDAIVRGILAPGTAINEAELAERFGVSRAPMREALSRLQAKGLIDRTAHLSARVIALTETDLREMFQMREALEGAAARLAVRNMRQEDIAALEAGLQEHEKQPDLAAGAAYYQAEGDRDFHFRIARASGNKRLFKTLCEDIYHLLRIYRFRSSVNPGRARKAFEEHLAVVDALRRRDPDRAETQMRFHIRQAWASIETRLHNDAQKRAEGKFSVMEPRAAE